MKELIYLFSTLTLTSLIDNAATGSGASAGGGAAGTASGSTGTAAGAVAPSKPGVTPGTLAPSVNQPLRPGGPNVFSRGGTNAFFGATNANFFGTNQFGTNFTSLSPLLGNLQNNIQQVLPLLASLTSATVAGDFPATNAASA